MLPSDEPMGLTSAPHTQRYRCYAVAFCVLGLILRLVLSWHALGTNDAYTWFKFGLLVDKRGLAEAYHMTRLLNHPPYPTMWAWVCWLIERDNIADFAFWMRMPAIVADMVSCLLIWRIALARQGPAVAFAATALTALSPVSILISAYHCNTDPVCVCLILLAMYKADRKRSMAAGAALGLAIDIKLVAVLAIPALLASSRSLKSFMRLLIGLSVGVLPFAWLLLTSGPTAIHRIAGYASSYEHWGLVYLFKSLSRLGFGHDLWVQWAWDFHDLFGKWLMLGAIVAAGWWGRQNRATAIALGTGAMTWFVVLAPGFGIQYLIYPAILSVARSARWGLWICATTSLFAASVYYVFLDLIHPLRSYFIAMFPTAAASVGLLAWGVLMGFAIWTTFVKPNVPRELPDRR